MSILLFMKYFIREKFIKIIFIYYTNSLTSFVLLSKKPTKHNRVLKNIQLAFDDNLRFLK